MGVAARRRVAAAGPGASGLELGLLRLGTPGAEIPVAFDDEGTARDISPVAAEIDGRFLIDGGIDAVGALLTAGTLAAVDSQELRIGAPIARPGKVICIGMNYRDRAEETGATVLDEPIVFLKASNTVIGPNDSVLIPHGSTATDWEVELAVIIGSTTRYLDSPADAAAVIAGYAISNDVSERDFQLHRGGQWTKGKSCETFNALGPWLVTPEDISDTNQLGCDCGSTADSSKTATPRT